MEMLPTKKLYNNPFTICIEGNIGSGKTTFLNHFQNLDNATILQEPMDLWRNVAGVNLLVSFFRGNVFVTHVFAILKHYRKIYRYSVESLYRFK